MNLRYKKTNTITPANLPPQKRPFVYSNKSTSNINNSLPSTGDKGAKNIQRNFEELLNTAHRTEREVKASLKKLRQLVLEEGLPEESLPKLDPSVQSLIRPNSLRSRVWKHFLGVYHVSMDEYVRLIKKGKSPVYDKIRNDTFRTMATDERFRQRVNEEMLIRVLNGFAWKMKLSGNTNIPYIQGMNVLAAPFLFTMSELDAFFSFSTFIQTCCPLYVTPTLEGAHCGFKLLDKCLQIIDSELYGHLASKNLRAEIYAFPLVLTFSACVPPLDELLKLWDFLLAYGIHLNILCIVAQLIMMKDRLLETSSPMQFLNIRALPPLNAKAIIDTVLTIVQQIPDFLYDLLVRHPFDPSISNALMKMDSLSGKVLNEGQSAVTVDR